MVGSSRSRPRCTANTPAASCASQLLGDVAQPIGQVIPFSLRRRKPAHSTARLRDSCAVRSYRDYGFRLDQNGLQLPTGCRTRTWRLVDMTQAFPITEARLITARAALRSLLFLVYHHSNFIWLAPFALAPLCFASHRNTDAAGCIGFWLAVGRNGLWLASANDPVRPTYHGAWALAGGDVLWRRFQQINLHLGASQCSRDGAALVYARPGHRAIRDTNRAHPRPFGTVAWAHALLQCWIDPTLRECA